MICSVKRMLVAISKPPAILAGKGAIMAGIGFNVIMFLTYFGITVLDHQNTPFAAT